MTSSWLVWLLCAVSGASMARFIHADSWLAPLRTRWEVHFLGRIDAVLNEADSQVQIARGSTDPTVIGKLRQEINNRSASEPGAPFWMRGEQRRRRRPWSTIREKLDRLSVYSNFLSCPWCLPFWVFAVAVAWTWGRVYGFSGEVFAPVHIPVDYALISLVLGLRWIYGTLVVFLGQDH